MNNYTVYMYTVCKGGGGYMGSQEGIGPQTDEHLLQCPFTGKFFKMTTIIFGVYIVNKSMIHLYAFKGAV